MNQESCQAKFSGCLGTGLVMSMVYLNTRGRRFESGSKWIFLVVKIFVSGVGACLRVYLHCAVESICSSQTPDSNNVTQ